jgi:hypothetical protein
MRVVIDFKQREMPYYESKVTSRQIILKIRESGAAAPAVTRHTPIAQLAEAPAAVATALPPTPQAPRTSAPLPLIPTLAPTPAETETPAATQTAAATATAAPTHTATAVSEYHLLDYRFEYVEESRIPVLKLLLDKSRPQAQISKVDERTYVIEVANCGLVRPSLALPQYPPSDFAGFLMVSSIASAERLTITITVDSGTTLGTFVKGSEIWVKRLS